MQKVFVYRLGKREVRINFWLLLIFLVFQTLLNELGFWQLDRAKEKQAVIEAIHRADNQVSSLLNPTAKQIANFARYDGEISWSAAPLLYVENQIKDGKVGYHILQLAQVEKSSKWFWVNRGWHIAKADRNQLPAVAPLKGKMQVVGRIYPMPANSIASEQQVLERLANGYRLSNLNQTSNEQLAEKLGLTIEPWQLRITKPIETDDSQSQLKIDWHWISMQPQKHLAYAIQWFALALALLIVSFIASLKKTDKKN